MYRDISKPPPPLPSPDLTELDEGIHLLKPLSRRGEGPGVILITPDYVGQLTITNGVPSPILKWAEEGYVVAEVQESALRRRGGQAITMALEAIATCDKCNSRSVGLVGKTTLPPLFFSFRQLLSSNILQHISQRHGKSWPLHSLNSSKLSAQLYTVAPATIIWRRHLFRFCSTSRVPVTILGRLV